jgi:hypothetical protein
MAGKQWMKGKPNGHISVDTVLKVTLFVLSAVGYLLAEIYSRTRAEIGENRRTIIALDQRASSAAERIANLEATCVRK